MTIATSTAVIDGIQLVYSTAGDPQNPAVLFIHGWGSRRGVWDDLITALSDTYYCIAPDVIGLGDSEKPQHADYGVPSQAAQIVALADALNVGQFALIGHSRGGQLALYIAARTAPDRVRAVISVAGLVNAATFNIETYTFARCLMAMYFPMLYDLTRAAAQWRPVLLFESMSAYYDVAAMPETIVRREFETIVRRETAFTIVATFRGSKATNLAPLLYDIQAPMLAIFGKHDNVVPVTQGLLVRDRVPGAQLYLYNECGHMIMFEKPDALLRDVREFLGRHIGAVSDTSAEKPKRASRAKSTSAEVKTDAPKPKTSRARKAASADNPATEAPPKRTRRKKSE
jgi:pimeloyl-ACP methyl ester carboxylesterase